MIQKTEEQANDFAKKSIALMHLYQKSYFYRIQCPDCRNDRGRIYKLSKQQWNTIFNFDDEDEFLEEMNNA